MGILNHFHPGHTPRPLQQEILRKVEQCWDTSDVIIIRVDVGGGKSHIADCISRWNYEKNKKKASIIVPTNPLANQYTNDFKDMVSIGHKAKYSTSGWREARASFTESPVRVGNYYTYLAHRAYSPLLLVDEAHKLISTLLEFDTMKVWRHLTPYPNFRNVLEAAAWTNEHKEDKRLKKLYETLCRSPEDYILKSGVENYRGKERELLKVLPLTPKNAKPFFWPRRVEKIVLLSATIGHSDVVDMGLNGRRVRLIEGGSPIPVMRRPIKYDPVGSFNYKNRTKNISKLMKRIEEYSEIHEGTKGFVHTTYSMARIMREHVPSHMKGKLIFHGVTNKAARLNSWLNSPPEEGKIFVGCGLTEGIDLKYDRCRWQVVSNIAFPNKSDMAVAAKMRTRPDWYIWEAVKQLEQARGRVCRAPDDKGTTYITATEFYNLYTRNRDMFSLPFKEALV